MTSVADVVARVNAVISAVEQANATVKSADADCVSASAQFDRLLSGSRDPAANTITAQLEHAHVSLERAGAIATELVAALDRIVSTLVGTPVRSQPAQVSAQAPKFGTPAWIATVGNRINPTKVKVTTGIGFADNGDEAAVFASGEDELSRSVQAVLEQSHQFPKPAGWRPGMALATAQHSETKHALWMRRNNVSHLTVVINHPRVCQPPYGCEVAVRTILPRGSSMTIVSSASGLRWVLKGVSEP